MKMRPKRTWEEKVVQESMKAGQSMKDALC